ncbi:MAG TPA: phage terminase large subunit [Deinococcales bacterium]|nr:phage terminase large subunit [Deinococcales bacterium]
MTEPQAGKGVAAGESVFVARGSAWAALQATEREVLVCGPAGTGKTRACLEKLNWLAETYPGSRFLLARKTRESLSETGLVTFEEQVRPGGCDTRNARRRTRQVYEYANGSSIAVAGLDKPTRVLSAEYDVVYVMEATEASEEDWEFLLTRLRNGRTPYQQLLACCNPDAGSHWLKRRADRGRTRIINAQHEDNPRLFDGRGWTPVGRAYLETLDALTGARHARLRLGQWASSEGLVFDEWDEARHVVEPFDVPRDWPRLRSLDFGYVNPSVCQWWAVNPDGGLLLYRELVRTRTLVPDLAAEIKKLEEGEPPPTLTVTDHDAASRHLLERELGVACVPAVKDLERGLQAVKARLAGVDGRPGLAVFRNALVARDPRLDAAGKPQGVLEEVLRYAFQPGAETPVKVDDHSMDALRYAAMARETRRAPLQVFL